MNKDDIAVLWDYSHWAWRRVLEQTAHLSVEQYTKPTAVPHSSLRGTLVHALSANYVWRSRWEGESPAALLAEADFSTFAVLRERWAVESEAMTRFVAGLAEERLNAVLHYQTTRGAPMSDVLWHLCVHVVNHGTQHRSEAAILLTNHGRSPGDLDFITYLRAAR